MIKYWVLLEAKKSRVIQLRLKFSDSHLFHALALKYCLLECKFNMRIIMLKYPYPIKGEDEKKKEKKKV